jgi:DNA-binding MarR family transcriptional regulator
VEDDRRSLVTTSDVERHAALDELTFMAALLYFRMRKAAEEMMGEGAQSSGRRSVLKSLSSGGPQTVPQMARFRAVSRQHVQKLVNGLVADGLVELVENPAHKRSRLVAITEAGSRLAEVTARRESEILPALAPEIPLEDLRTATRVLGRLKAAFEGEEWRSLLEGKDPTGLV